MTTFRPDTSFPYLKIAREYGVDYGDVIRCADTWDARRGMIPQEKESFHRLSKNEALIDAITDAVFNERSRRLQIETQEALIIPQWWRA